MITIFDINNIPIRHVSCPRGMEDIQCSSEETWKEGYTEVIKIERTDSEYLLSKINEEYTNFASQLLTGIPDDEVLTFPIQQEEAKAWFKDNSEPTPFIDGMLTKRTNITKEQLVAKIIDKANTYAYNAGVLTGERQKQEKLILDGEQNGNNTN